jgi:acetyl-CoA carboxylase carboxyltransferase component
VLKDTNRDPRIEEAREKLGSARAFYQKDFDELFQKVYAEKQNALAQKFDRTHSVERAREVGSIDDIIALKDLRPYLIARVAEGINSFPPRDVR